MSAGGHGGESRMMLSSAFGGVAEDDGGESR